MFYRKLCSALVTLRVFRPFYDNHKCLTDCPIRSVVDKFEFTRLVNYQQTITTMRDNPRQSILRLNYGLQSYQVQLTIGNDVLRYMVSAADEN